MARWIAGSPPRWTGEIQPLADPMASAVVRVLLLIPTVASSLAGRTDALRSLGVGDEARAGAAAQGEDAVDLNPTSLGAFLTASWEQFAVVEFFAHWSVAPGLIRVLFYSICGLLRSIWSEINPLHVRA